MSTIYDYASMSHTEQKKRVLVTALAKMGRRATRSELFGRVHNHFGNMREFDSVMEVLEEMGQVERVKKKKHSYSRKSSTVYELVGEILL